MIEGLNERQREAVTHPGGAMLVLAGAGSGKTRAITHRIAWLVLEAGVPAERIVAVTFTNKAAAEMRERVERLLGPGRSGAWIGTFHALCLRILRRDGVHVGLQPGFNIYDSDDQVALVRRLLKDGDVDRAEGSPRAFLSRISRAKNAMESPDAYAKRAFSPQAKLTAMVYEQYEAALRRANAVDFDDLLLKTLDLLGSKEHAAIADGYASRCAHLLVDEYQDTNRPQYLLVRRLACVHGNVCVVGDEDQSIYRFRGAEIRNILDFERDYPDTVTIRLEQNYRSTGTIIRAAGAVIANNVYRKGKNLWTSNPDGEKLTLYHAPDDRSEAVWVAEQVKRLEAGYRYESIAVLYRTNAQSRQLEEIFRRDRIPYQIVGSVQFYERKEVKDLLAHLKLAANPADDVSFRRVVNTPPRGIGGTTMTTVEDVARGMGLPLMEAAAHAVQQRLLPARSSIKLESFLDFLADLTRGADDGPVAEMLERIVEIIDYESFLEKSYPGQGQERMDNVRSLISAAVEYAEENGNEGLQGFLDRSALVAGADEVGARPGVTLMTVHCAKGLEFPVVFLIGLEENLFPHAMSQASDEDIEEERRLCYVAMTRAQRRLFLSHAAVRRIQGAMIPNPPSRFIEETPAELIEEAGDGAAGEGFFGGWRVRGGDRSAWSGNGSSAARAATRGRSTARPTAVPRAVAAAKANPSADGYSVGAMVDHPCFGGGRILDREGSGKNLKLTIHFSAHGAKKILPAYTKLSVRTG